MFPAGRVSPFPFRALLVEKHGDPRQLFSFFREFAVEGTGNFT